jgi:hypothetical protein
MKPLKNKVFQANLPASILACRGLFFGLNRGAKTGSHKEGEELSLQPDAKEIPIARSCASDVEKSPEECNLQPAERERAVVAMAPRGAEAEECEQVASRLD